MDNTQILWTDLKRNTKVYHIARRFPNATAITLPTGPDGQILGFAEMDFATVQEKQIAFFQNGTLFGNNKPRPIVMAIVLDGDVRRPLFVIVRNLNPRVRRSDLAMHFASVARRGVIAHVPMIPEENINRGYGFVYFQNLEDFENCLDQFDGSDFMGSFILVSHGAFTGVRGVGHA